MPVDFTANIRIDGAGYAYTEGATGYESSVGGCLRNLNSTKTGKVLIGFFGLRKRRVTILPLEDRCAVDAQQSVILDSERDFDKSFPKGSPVRTFQGAPVPNRTGLGGGIPAIVRFDTKGWPNPERVLIHELFHALRVVFGFQERLPMGTPWGNSEELYSVFVENMYAGEMGLGMRESHASRSLVQATPDHSMANHREFHVPMRRLSEMMPTIARGLAQVSTSYNPFRDWANFQGR